MSVRSRAVLLALIALATAAPAAAARPAALPALAHQLYLYGTGSGYVRVRLTAPVTVGSGPRLTVLRNSNIGGFVGALLVREHPQADGVGVLQAWQPGGVPRQVPVAFGPVAERIRTTGRAVLAPGTYRLYLLARGDDPVHAIVFLTGAPGGIGGRRYLTVPPNAPVYERFVAAPRVAPAGHAAPAAAASGTHALPRRGLLVRAGWWGGAAGGDTPFALHHCAYADPAAALPGCAGGAGTGAAAELRSTWSAAAAEVVSPATWTQQVALTVAGAPTDAGAALVWADLGPGFPAG